MTKSSCLGTRKDKRLSRCYSIPTTTRFQKLNFTCAKTAEAQISAAYLENNTDPWHTRVYPKELLVSGDRNDHGIIGCDGRLKNAVRYSTCESQRNSITYPTITVKQYHPSTSHPLRDISM